MVEFIPGSVLLFSCESLMLLQVSELDTAVYIPACSDWSTLSCFRANALSKRKESLVVKR